MMTRLRPELIRGFAFLGIFLVLMLSTNYLFPYSFEQSGYTVVDVRRLHENPLPLEGSAISSSVTVASIIDHGSYYSSELSDGITLVFPSAMIPPEEGQRILIRGTSWFLTNGSIFIQEYYVLDTGSSIIRSIPGIALFIVLFFMVFRIDFGQLAFTSRKGGDEDA
jgi:hypothetical protein